MPATCVPAALTAAPGPARRDRTHDIRRTSPDRGPGTADVRRPVGAWGRGPASGAVALVALDQGGRVVGDGDVGVGRQAPRSSLDDVEGDLTGLFGHLGHAAL